MVNETVAFSRNSLNFAMGFKRRRDWKRGEFFKCYNLVPRRWKFKWNILPWFDDFPRRCLLQILPSEISASCHISALPPECVQNFWIGYHCNPVSQYWFLSLKLSLLLLQATLMTAFLRQSSRGSLHPYRKPSATSSWISHPKDNQPQLRMWR